MTQDHSGRKRDAAATRQSILASAKTAFARSGYDGAGLREIASVAGVTAMMVNHHFGSKEQLFEAVVANAMETPAIMRGDVLASSDLADRLAHALVENTSADHAPLEGFVIVVKSVANPRAAEICRQQIERYHHSWLAEALTGEHAQERAGLILAMLTGFQFMRKSMRLTALVGAPPERLVKMLRDSIAVLIENTD